MGFPRQCPGAWNQQSLLVLREFSDVGGEFGEFQTTLRVEEKQEKSKARTVIAVGIGWIKLTKLTPVSKSLKEGRGLGEFLPAAWRNSWGQGSPKST